MHPRILFGGPTCPIAVLGEHAIMFYYIINVSMRLAIMNGIIQLIDAFSVNRLHHVVIHLYFLAS